MTQSTLAERGGLCNLRPVTRWSDEKFRARVSERAKELGLSLRQVLERAGLAEDYLRRHPGKQGRGVLNIEAIAEACNWTIAQALGFLVGDDESGPLRQPDPRKLRVALEAADRTIGANLTGPARLDALVELQASAYDLLVTWETRKGVLLSDSDALSLVEEVLSREFSRSSKELLAKS